MKKILVILVLSLSSLCFTAEGFKDLKWGASKEEVIQKMGKGYKVDKNQNALVYKNVEFSALDLSSLTFIFDGDDLTAWDSTALTTKRQLSDLIEAYKNKYGERSIYKEVVKEFTITTIEGKTGLIKIWEMRLPLPNNQVSIQINYRKYKQEELKKQKNESEEEYNERLTKDL